MEREARIAVIWVAAVVVGISGAFVVEATHPGVRRFAVDWPVLEEGPFEARGSLAQGDLFEFPFDVVVRNVTAVRAEVRWTDEVGDPDTMELAILGPKGLSASPVDSTEGALVVELPVASRPATHAVRASDEDAVERGAGDSFASDAAVGRWTFQVRLADAPGTSVPGSGVELQPDGGNDFELMVTLDAYRLRIG